jgi:hypothetical protein
MTKRLLEIFSGTKSVSKAWGHAYTETVSVDIVKNFTPTHLTDIMDWDYRQYPPGHFHTIWASPPCTQYSKAKTRGVRDIDGANAIVQRTIEIIGYFNPVYYFMENPQTGKLKEQPVMRGIPYYDVDYCQYGKSYRKRTRIWTSLTTFTPRLCPGKYMCVAMEDGKHKLSCGNGNPVYTERAVGLHEKYSIPQQLLEELLAAMR